MRILQSNGLDIQQAYTFSLETMPVQKRISVGETAEIRCTLVREGRYDGAQLHDPLFPARRAR